MEEVMKQRLTSRNLWRRALFMLLFVLVYGIAEAVVAVVVVVQFFFVLISGRANENLLVFGNNLSTYFRQILQFQTFNSEFLPYPFGDWPDEGLGSDLWLEEVPAEHAEAVAPVAGSETTAQGDGGSRVAEGGPIDRAPTDGGGSEPEEDSPAGSSDPEERDPKA